MYSELRYITALTLLLSFPSGIRSFGFKIPNIFPQSVTTALAPTISGIDAKTSELLEAVSNTANGKNASPQKQAEILKLVGELEQLCPPADDLLTNGERAQQLDGVWYLQFTCPSNVNTETASDGASEWNPENLSDNNQVETKQFQARGTISATGVTVDTSERVVKQIFDIRGGKVTNEIGLGWCTLSVTGSFRPSSAGIPRRAVVGFEELRIALGGEDGPTLNLDFLFKVIGKIQNRQVGGWLETTFLSDEVRIGRGNKGTCFVLTRDYEAVTP